MNNPNPARAASSTPARNDKTCRIRESYQAGQALRDDLRPFAHSAQINVDLWRARLQSFYLRFKCLNFRILRLYFRLFVLKLYAKLIVNFLYPFYYIKELCFLIFSGEFARLLQQQLSSGNEFGAGHVNRLFHEGFASIESRHDVAVVAEKDANQQALEQVEKITESDRDKGEDLLESEELKRQLREAKERLESGKPPRK